MAHGRGNRGLLVCECCGVLKSFVTLWTGARWGTAAKVLLVLLPRVQRPQGKAASQGAHLHGDIPTAQPSRPGSLSLGPGQAGRCRGDPQELQGLGAVLPRLAHSPGKAAAEY